MTTIACDGLSIVADSQLTDGNGIIVGYTKKIIRLDDGRLYASCGSSDDSELVIEWLNDGAIKKDKPEVSDEFAAIVLGDDLFLYTRKLVAMKMEAPYFLGSGYELAKAAHDACGDLQDAVMIACKYDIYSGGDIQVMDYE